MCVVVEETAMTDSERLDYLESEMKREPLVLHNLMDLRGPYRGLGLIQGFRTLRQSIDEMAGIRPTVPKVVQTNQGEK